MTRVLVVDDEPAIVRLLTAILTRGGYETISAEDAQAALAHLATDQVDALLLDLGLPDRDGLEVIGTVRAASPVPIIVVTARSEVAEKIAALDLGADDYVTKPFDGDELLARLRSALRRSKGKQEADEQVAYGPITMDRGRREAKVRGEPVTLTRREFEVLFELVAAAGRVLTHATLLKKVWGKAHVDDIDYLRVVVRALRLKVEEKPSAPTLIRNEPGIGYRLLEG